MNSYEEPGGFKICLIIYGEVERQTQVFIQKIGVTSMTIYQGRVLDALSLLPVSNVNLTISPGP